MDPPNISQPFAKRADLEHLILIEKQPRSAVLNWLATGGVNCQERTLRAYCRNLRREQGYRAREDDIRNALKLQDPAGTETRKLGTKRKRRLEYIVPGPNYLWSIDGHDKLVNYGIEIYGVIDAYSYSSSRAGSCDL